MTTSRLSTHAFELTSNDLQALRDYALEAPFEWRKALLALVEHAEEVPVDVLEDLRGRLEDAHEEIEAQKNMFISEIDTLLAHLDITLGTGPSELRSRVEQLRETVLEGMDSLLHETQDPKGPK